MFKQFKLIFCYFYAHYLILVLSLALVLELVRNCVDGFSYFLLIYTYIYICSSLYVFHSFAVLPGIIIRNKGSDKSVITELSYCIPQSHVAGIPLNCCDCVQCRAQSESILTIKDFLQSKCLLF